MIEPHVISKAQRWEASIKLSAPSDNDTYPGQLLIGAS